MWAAAALFLGAVVLLLEVAGHSGRLSTRSVVALAVLAGGGVGAAAPIQVAALQALLAGASPLTAVQGLVGAGWLPFVLLGLGVAVGAGAGVAAHHRATLDPADVRAGTPGHELRALVLSLVVGLPSFLAVFCAPLVTALLLVGCRLEARIGRWLATPGAEAAAARRARLPGVPRERLELAAYAGDACARALVEAPFAAPGLAGWADGLRVFGQDACLVAGAAAVGAVVPVFERDHPGDPRARAAWRALIALAEEGAAEAARAAVEPLDGPCGDVARAVLAIDGAAALGRATASALQRAAELVGSAEVIQAAASEALQARALR